MSENPASGREPGRQPVKPLGTSPASSSICSFDDWVPRDYLAEYFGELQEDERLVIAYFVEQMRAAEVGPVLVFGCGPGLNHAFLTAPYASELVLSDHLVPNLLEIEDWLHARSTAHDWNAFVQYTLACESSRTPTDLQIEAREDAVRNMSARLLWADAHLEDPLGSVHRGGFATVLSPFCADSATRDKGTWARYCRNIATLVRPGGLFLTAALRRSVRYRVGSRYFPSANIDESDLRNVLTQHFIPDTVQVLALNVPEQAAHGYAGILLARARKAR